MLMFIPNKLWLHLGVISVGCAVIMGVFYKGTSYGSLKCAESHQKRYEKLLLDSVTALQLEVDNAIKRQQEGQAIIEELNTKYSNIEKENTTLQQALDDAIKIPPVCNKLDPRYYELYKSKYNRKAP